MIKSFDAASARQRFNKANVHLRTLYKSLFREHDKSRWINKEMTLLEESNLNNSQESLDSKLDFLN